MHSCLSCGSLACRTGRSHGLDRKGGDEIASALEKCKLNFGAIGAAWVIFDMCHSVARCR